MIRLDEDVISVEDFNYLTDKVGWGTRDANVVEEALNNTLYSVSIYDDNKIIGYGRIIGDKTIFLYIQDIMVVPEYQGKKIGTKIMNTLLSKVDEYKKVNPNIHIFFLFFIYNNIVIKNINAHIAQGLKPSTKPIRIEMKGRDISLVLTSPIIGKTR